MAENCITISVFHIGSISIIIDIFYDPFKIGPGEKYYI